MPEDGPLRDYLHSAALAVAATHCEIVDDDRPLSEGVRRLIAELDAMTGRGGTCWLFGNGGSGTIADHIACDMVLHGWRAHALTNMALLTTMANDYGRSFAGQLQRLARAGDVLIGMSCSGESHNVASALIEIPSFCYRVAMSGFRSANRMHRLPLDLNFWTPADNYAATQIAHLTILHAVIDLAR